MHQTAFPMDALTIERFTFAWKTIQARTFGRRLPWTALVPFADCLNHANVATTYDFDTDHNGLFRLFTGSGTHFGIGHQVFNSYGRRPNFQLLLDYGFALTDNEWDYVDVTIPMDTVRALGPRCGIRKVLRLDRRTQVDTLLPKEAFAHGSALRAPRMPRLEALRLVQSQIDAFRVQLGTDVEADEDRISRNDSEMSERLRMAIVYRLGQQKVLDAVLSQIEEHIQKCSDDDRLDDLEQEFQWLETTF